MSRTEAGVFGATAPGWRAAVGAREPPRTWITPVAKSMSSQTRPSISELRRPV
ncbi:MAG TPA: hypothetical protein VHF45_09265 [Thermoleophilaceae bacterium]|nr:hypothetical protein [Thermoleophilaceae bacterium]